MLSLSKIAIFSLLKLLLALNYAVFLVKISSMFIYQSVLFTISSYFTYNSYNQYTCKRSLSSTRFIQLPILISS
jgi:hypothetical protein